MPTKAQQEGVPAVFVKGDSSVALLALDMGGRDRDLYVERQYPSCVICNQVFQVGYNVPLPDHQCRLNDGSISHCNGSNIQGRMPDAEPKFFCPECGKHFLVEKEIYGPNSVKSYSCPDAACGTRWKRSDDMRKGVGLVMM